MTNTKNQQQQQQVQKQRDIAPNQAFHPLVDP